MTTTANPPQPNTAQMILRDTQALRQDTATILELARKTMLPLEGEEMSVLDAMLGLLQTIVHRMEQIDQSLAALHQRFDQPGIANALQRMINSD